MNNKKGKNAHQVVEGANGIVEVQGNNTNLVQTDGQTNGRLEPGESTLFFAIIKWSLSASSSINMTRLQMFQKVEYG